jgi:hypothetical protein
MNNFGLRAKRAVLYDARSTAGIEVFAPPVVSRAPE